MPSKYIKDIFIVSVTSLPPPSSPATLPILLQAAVHFKGALSEKFKQKKALKHTKGLPLFYRNGIGVTWLFPPPSVPFWGSDFTSFDISTAWKGDGRVTAESCKTCF